MWKINCCGAIDTKKNGTKQSFKEHKESESLQRKKKGKSG